MDGKAESFAKRAEDQLLQPYVDHDRFFEERWISARCIISPAGRPASIQYYVDPPQEWQQDYKDRVRKHFDDFGLGKRFSVKAAQLLETTIVQIENLKKLNLTNAVIRAILIAPGINKAPFINHWQRGMFQALSDYLP